MAAEEETCLKCCQKVPLCQLREHVEMCNLPLELVVSSNIFDVMFFYTDTLLKEHVCFFLPNWSQRLKLLIP